MGNGIPVGGVSGFVLADSGALKALDGYGWCDKCAARRIGRYLDVPRAGSSSRIR